MKAIFLFVVAILLVSCGLDPISGSSSGLYQLTLEDYPCKTWPEGRVEAVNSRLDKDMMKGWDRSSHRPLIFQAMAGVPDLYLGKLNALHVKNSFHISPRSSLGGVTLYPSYIYVGDDVDSINLALQHEVGHVVEYFARDMASDGDPFEDDFDEELAVTAKEHHDNPYLNAYPASFSVESEVYKQEYFAEAFNSYYCSENTNALIRKQFPSTYAFLTKYLQKPVWISQ